MKKILKSLFSLLVVLGLVSVVAACNKKTEEHKTPTPVETEKTPAPTPTPTPETPTPTPGTPTPETPTPGELFELELTALLADDGAGAYTVVAENGTANITVSKSETADPSHEWAHVVAELNPTNGVAHMQSLRFMISGTCVVLLKVESSVGGKEVKLQLNDTATAYEWDLSGTEEQAILAGENVKFIMFALPGAKKGEGSVKISNLYISVEEAMFNPIQSGFTNIEENCNNYDGVSETFDFNNHWADAGESVYEFEYTQDGTLVKYNKNGEWNYAGSPIAGAFAKFPYIAFVVTGTAGDAVILKAECGAFQKEIKVEFTGERQVACLDLSEYTESQRSQLARMIFFAAPGKKDVQGSFLIHEAYFTMEAPAVELPEATKLVYNGLDKSFNLNSNWYSGDEGVYEITNGQSPWAVSYNKAVGQEWAALKVDMEGQFGNFETLTFGLEVPAGVKYIVKIAGADGAAAEYEGEGNGQCDGHTIDLSKLTVAQRDSLNTLFIFMDFNNATTGTFNIHWVGLEGFKYRGVGAVEYNGGEAAPDMNAMWSAFGGAGCYTLERPEGQPWSITYDKTADDAWTCVVAYVLGGKLGNFSKLTGGLEIAEGKQILIKVEGDGVAKELWYTGTGAYEGFEFDLSSLTVEQRNKINKVLLFPEGGNSAAVAGEMKVHWMTFAGYENQDTPATTLIYDGSKMNSFNLNPSASNWLDADGGIYTVTGTGPITVDYNKAAGKNWAALKLDIKGPFGNFNSLSFGLEVAEGVKYIVKLQGPNGYVEFKGVGTGQCDGQKLDISSLSFEQRDALTNVYIFIDYENGDANQGSYKIHWMGMADYADRTPAPEAPETYNVEEGFVSLDEGLYNFTTADGVTTMTYEKGAGTHWACATLDLEYPITSYTRLEFEVELSEGASLLIKLQGNPSIEFKVTESGVGYIDLTGENAEKLASMTKVVLFGNPNEENVSGTIVIKNLEFVK